MTEILIFFAIATVSTLAGALVYYVTQFRMMKELAQYHADNYAGLVSFIVSTTKKMGAEYEKDGNVIKVNFRDE